VKPEFFCNFEIFIGKMLIKLGICLNGLHGIHLNLIRIAVFMVIHFMTHVHSMLNLSMLLFGVICVILLRIMLVHVLIMHAILSLTHLYF